MFYTSKEELAKAKKMNRKCREAGVIALDYDGWGACVENTITGYRHTWNVTKEKVCNYSERE